MASAAGLLAGRLAFITGGGSGIGRAVCHAFEKQGAFVATMDVNKEHLQKTISALPSEGNHKLYVGDVSDASSVSDVLSQIKDQFNQVPSISVNCAGITDDHLMIKMSEESFNKVLDVNLKGTFLVTQMVAKQMIEAKVSPASIINISSIVGKTGNMGQCNYAASKAGVVGFTKTAAKELARWGIRCNAILPGFIETPMLGTIPEKIMEMVSQQIPIGRMGKPEEIANTCVFLASEMSSYITGTPIEVTGGLMI